MMECKDDTSSDMSKKHMRDYGKEVIVWRILH